MSSIDNWTEQVHEGDVVKQLKKMPDNSVHTVVLAPPDAMQEKSVGEYISRLVDVTEELQRVLRQDGSMWLNISDWYGATSDGSERNLRSVHSTISDGYHDSCKSLVPHRAAIELVKRGWVARNDALAELPNAVPSEKEDRLAQKFSLFFHFSQKQQYYYDLDKIRAEYQTDLDKEPPIGGEKHQENKNRTYSGNSPERTGKGKNPGDVIELSESEGDDSHVNSDLAELAVKATCPQSVCGECGEPYHKTTTDEDKVVREKDCNCDTDSVQPGVVLDPMCSDETVWRVAADRRREFVGITDDMDGVEPVETDTSENEPDETELSTYAK